jgi:hypothetical protein
MNKKGLTIWEIVLFTLFLSVALGASVFFFILNSRDVQNAQKKFHWVKDINLTLDEISLELANAVVIDFPFSGAAKEVLFRGAMNSGGLVPSLVQEGFSFSDNSLNYVAKNASANPGLRRLGKPANPLVANCIEGKFTRIGPDQIFMSFKAYAPDNSAEFKTFSRTIYLRNQ